MLGLTLLAFGLRVYDLAAQSLWVDEAFSIRLAGGDVGAILAALATSDVHPPLHYLALHFWLGVAGSGEFAARYLSLVFSVASVPLLFALGRRLFGSGVALVAAALLAVSPFAVAYAQEARMYAMVAAWCLGSLYFFAMLASDEARAPSRRRAWVGYVLCTTLAIYTQYYAALVVLFQNAFLLVPWMVSQARRRQGREGTRRAGSIGPWIAAQAAVAILFLPWLPFFLGPLGWWSNSWVAAPGVAEFLQRSWQTLNLGMAVDDRQVATVLAGIASLFLLGLAAAGLGRLRRDARWLLFAFLGVAMPAAVLLAISQARSIFNPKFLLLELPLYLLALAYAVSAIARRGRLAGLLAAVVVTVVAAAGLAGYYRDSRYAKDDFRGLAEYISRNAGPQDVVAVDTEDAFGYYYRGQAEWQRLPKQYPAVAGSMPGELTALAAGHGGNRLFLAQWSQDETDPQGLLRFLLDKHGQLLEQVPMGRNSLWVYQLPAEPAFDLTATPLARPVSFDGRLLLTAASFGAAGTGAAGGAVASGAPLWVVLRFRQPAATDEDYRVSMKLWNRDGHLAGQVDQPLWDSTHLPTSGWRSGQEVTAGTILPVFAAVPPGEYRLELSLYTLGRPQPLAVVNDALGGFAGTTAVLGDVTVVRQEQQPALTDLGIERGRAMDAAPGVRFLGYNLGGQEAAAGEALAVTLFWQVTGSPAADYTPLLSLRDAVGAVVSSGSPSVEDDQYPFSQWASGEIGMDWQELPVPPATVPGQYWLVLDMLGPDGERITEAGLGSVEVSGRQREFAVPPMAYPQAANLGGKVRLLGWDVEPAGASLRPGDTLHLVLHWQAIVAMDRSYTVFAHLLSNDGRLGGQQDGIPGNGTLPTTTWLPGEVISDSMDLVLRRDAAPGSYRLAIGLYELATLQRMPVLDAPGGAAGDQVWLQGRVFQIGAGN